MDCHLQRHVSVGVQSRPDESHKLERPSRRCNRVQQHREQTGRPDSEQPALSRPRSPVRPGARNARLNADGSLDTTFNPLSGVNGPASIVLHSMPEAKAGASDRICTYNLLIRSSIKDEFFLRNIGFSRRATSCNVRRRIQNRIQELSVADLIEVVERADLSSRRDYSWQHGRLAPSAETR